MELLWLFIGVLAGIFVSTGIGWFRSRKRLGKPAKTDKKKPDFTIEDMIRFASLNTMQDVTSLVMKYKLNVKVADFYERYQALNKEVKDSYFNELLIIFSKDKQQFVQELFDRYPGLSVQDVLLLLMTEKQIDNKTIARIMGITSAALKKRKTRLKSKMQPDGAEEDI